MEEDSTDLIKKYSSLKLTTSNYTVFVVSFRNNVGSYGEAGIELIKESYYDFEKVFPFKTKTITEPTMLANGTIINSTRDWDVKLDNAGLINDRKTWKDSKLKYQQYRGRLWTHIMSALSAEVIQLVQGQFEEFTILQLTYDTLGLWRLIKRCILEQGDSKPEKIHALWSNQVQGTLSVLDYTSLLHSYLTMLRESDLYPSNEAQVMNFLRGCDKLRYSTVIGRSLYEKVDNSSTLATWTTLFQRYDTEFAKVLEEKSKKDRNYTVMAVKEQFTREVEPWDAKVKTAFATRRDPAKDICHNCLRTGHYSRSCPDPAVTCSHCNRTGHRVEVCREKAREGQGPVANRSKGRAKGKAYKAKSILSKSEPDHVALKAVVSSRSLSMYEPDSESDSNYEPLYPCVYSSSSSSSNIILDEPLPSDLFMYDSGANVHIVSSLDMLEEMIKAAGLE